MMMALNVTVTFVYAVTFAIITLNCDVYKCCDKCVKFVIITRG